MKKMQRPVSGVERSKFRWQEPELIDLTRSRRKAVGTCGGGSGDFNCNPNGTNATVCNSFGITN